MRLVKKDLKVNAGQSVILAVCVGWAPLSLGGAFVACKGGICSVLFTMHSKTILKEGRPARPSLRYVCSP